MRRLTRTLALLVIALWGLATVHCDLELLTGFEFLACGQQPSPTSHQDNECDRDGCAAVESGLYRMEEASASAPVPLLVVSFLPPVPEVAPPVARIDLQFSPAPPLELARIWQFYLRAAQPPRAPSFGA